MTEPICKECGADLTKRGAVTASTSGYYSYRGSCDKDGQYTLNADGLVLSAFDEIDGLVCTKCGEELTYDGFWSDELFDKDLGDVVALRLTREELEELIALAAGNRFAFDICRRLQDIHEAVID